MTVAANVARRLQRWAQLLPATDPRRAKLEAEADRLTAGIAQLEARAAAGDAEAVERLDRVHALLAIAQARGDAGQGKP